VPRRPRSGAPRSRRVPTGCAVALMGGPRPGTTACALWSGRILSDISNGIRRRGRAFPLLRRLTRVSSPRVSSPEGPKTKVSPFGRFLGQDRASCRQHGSDKCEPPPYRYRSKHYIWFILNKIDCMLNYEY
jgi:hypothetical protein